MGKKRPGDQAASAALEALLDDILTDAHGDDELLWALRQAFEDNVELPADAFIIGEPVSVIEIDDDGNERRGLTATCRREMDLSTWSQPPIWPSHRGRRALATWPHTASGSDSSPFQRVLLHPRDACDSTRPPPKIST